MRRRRGGAPRLPPPLVALAALHLAAAAAGFVAPYDPTAQDRARPFAPPQRLRLVDAAGRLHARPFVYPWAPREGRFAEYDADARAPVELSFLVREDGALRLFGGRGGERVALLGTDRFGRDVFSRLVHGARLSLAAGLAAAVLAVGLGTLAGAIAGFAGGLADRFLMRGAELFLALPWLYLLLGVRAFLPLDTPPASSFLLVVGLVGLLAWPRPARLARAVAAAQRDGEVVAAARGFGARAPYLLARHVLPATAGVAATQLALLVPQVIAADLTLSFLGLGVPEPTPSWGLMLVALRQVHVLTTAWWLLAPAAALVVVSLAYHRLAVALAARWAPEG